MRLNKFRYYNKEAKMFFYCERGIYYSDSECKNSGVFVFNWDEAEQFTGLKDKNEVEVCEGDNVRCRMFFENTTLPCMGTIEYSLEFAAFCVKNAAGQTLLHHFDLDSFEVIGNIHETK